jgi:ubiquinone/menaquinone biosynthesis C-methylase UbiE
MSADFSFKSINYDKVSAVYDVSRAVCAETVNRLIETLHVDKRSHLLDLGCGTGNYAGAFSHYAADVTGIDISAGMLRQARTKFPDIQFIQGDVTQLPFGSNTFDGAFTVQVLHHIKEKGKFLKETFRVLKKGAYFAIDSCSHRQMRTFWFYHYFPKGLEVDLARIPDCAEIASLLEKSGFINVGVETYYSDIIVDYDKPERYLEKEYRDGQSTFYLLSPNEIESGCQKLREDIESGIITNIILPYKEKEMNTGCSCIIYGQKRSISHGT